MLGELSNVVSVQPERLEIKIIQGAINHAYVMGPQEKVPVLRLG